MTGITYIICEQDLHAYIDGALGDDRKRAVETYMSETPEAAAMVACYRAQKQMFQLLPHSPELLEEPTRALCTEISRQFMARPFQCRLEWNKRPGKRVSLSSGR